MTMTDSAWRTARLTWRSLILMASVAFGTTEVLCADDAADSGKAAPATATIDAETGLTALNKQKTVLLDRERKRILLRTQVVLREGLLEMLLCRAHTKEHESVLAVDSEAYIIHAGLLAVGAEPGHPVRFQPEFQPPAGQQIDIWLNWKDADGKAHRIKAQKWVRHVTRRYYAAPLAKLPEGLTIPKESELKYDAANEELVWFGPMTAAQRDQLKALSDDKAYRKGIDSFYERSQPRELDADWVFAGSGFFTQKDGEKWYQAEAGNVICVANFGDAMIDLAIRSSATNDALMFEPYTERIPPVGTPVLVELIPVTKPAAPEPNEATSPGTPPSQD